MSSRIISRIAPTPSGYLHAGNVYNFILTYLYTRAAGGVLHLRIDDYDLPRYRSEYVQNIFDVLEFLKLDYDSGARNLSEFEAKFSSKFRINAYRAALLNLGDKTYVCECSRTTPNAYENGIYRQICAGKGLKFERGRTAVRLRVDEADEPGAQVARELGDFIVWKKDDTPAYNLASIVDDEALGINLLVRGADLADCTRAQIYLARRLNLALADAKFIHHELLLQEGKKLSKSQGAPAIDRTLGAKFYYDLVARRLGLDVKCADSLANLLYEFELKFKASDQVG